MDIIYFTCRFLFIDDANKMVFELKNIILWIFGRQLFYKLLDKQVEANIYLRPDIGRMIMNRMESNDENLIRPPSAESEHKSDKANKLVDTKILLKMLQIFDLNARVLVRSFFSKTLMLAAKEGDRHANCSFKMLNFTMNKFATVSIGCLEENIEQWNLRGPLKLHLKSLQSSKWSYGQKNEFFFVVK